MGSLAKLEGEGSVVQTILELIACFIDCRHYEIELIFRSL